MGDLLTDMINMARPDPAAIAYKEALASVPNRPGALAPPRASDAQTSDAVTAMVGPGYLDSSANVPAAFLSTQNSSAPTMPETAPLTSGRVMEGKSRQSIDDILSGLYQSQKQQEGKDDNLAWMQFFSKMASSPSSSFLGAAGAGASALSDTMQSQEAARRQSATALGLADIKSQELQKEQALKETEAASKSQLEAAQAKFYASGGAQANRIIPVIDPDTNEITYRRAGEAMSGGFKPVSGYNAMTITLSPDAIDAAADALAKGATPSSLGLGYGASANKAAVYNRFSEKYPGQNLADAQIEMTGNKSGARTIGTAGGKIELASESLKSMIPLAKEAAAKIDSTQYPSINAIENAVRSGTGDPNIIALNTYLNAVQADHAALLVRTGVSTDSAREKARQMANAAMSKGQLGAYFDAVGNEIVAQRQAIANAKHVYGAKTPDETTATAPVASPAPLSSTRRPLSEFAK